MEIEIVFSLGLDYNTHRLYSCHQYGFKLQQTAWIFHILLDYSNITGDTCAVQVKFRDVVSVYYKYFKMNAKCQAFFFVLMSVPVW